MMSYNVTCHVTLQSYASSLSIKIKIKIKIKSRKINKRKREMLVSKAFHNRYDVRAHVYGMLALR